MHNDAALAAAIVKFLSQLRARGWWVAGCLLAVLAAGLETPPGHSQFWSMLWLQLLGLLVIGALLVVPGIWPRMLGRLAVLTCAGGAFGSQFERLTRLIFGAAWGRSLTWDFYAAMMLAVGSFACLLILTRYDLRRLQRDKSDPAAEATDENRVQRDFLLNRWRQHRFWTGIAVIFGMVAVLAIMLLIERPNSAGEISVSVLGMLAPVILVAGLWAPWDTARVLATAAVTVAFVPAGLILCVGGGILTHVGLTGAHDGNLNPPALTTVIVGLLALFSGLACLFFLPTGFRLLRTDLKVIASRNCLVDLPPDPEESWTNQVDWDHAPAASPAPPPDADLTPEPVVEPAADPDSRS